MEPFIGMRAVIKAHDETANSKIDVKACLLKTYGYKPRGVRNKLEILSAVAEIFS